MLAGVFRKAFAAALLALLCATTAAAGETGPRLSVEGHGEVAATPDMATVSVGVLREARTADAALDATSAAMAAVLSRLEAAGLEGRDIRTSGISLSPRWDQAEKRDGPPRIAGFTARNQLTLRVRDLALLGAVLDAVVTEGANELGGVAFGLADESIPLAEARRRAVADALTRARLYAEAAGVRLVRIVHIGESGGGIPYPRAEMAMMAREMAGAVPVAEGELTVSAGVSLVFEIE